MCNGSQKYAKVCPHIQVDTQMLKCLQDKWYIFVNHSVVLDMILDTNNKYTVHIYVSRYLLTAETGRYDRQGQNVQDSLPLI